ncbi:MAG: hypothetical protein ACRDI2_12980 [Chloroflexota bacterium]
MDEPAESAIAAAADFLAQRGVSLTHQTPYSVAFAASDRAGGGSEAGVSGRWPAAPTQASGNAPGDGVLQPGTGQVAAVPVQLKPEWCRIWVTVQGEGSAITAADAYVAQQRERSQCIAAAVRQLEKGIYDESRWPAYESTLRASLQRQHHDPAVIDEKVAAFKKRWLALGRKAAKARPESPDARS